MNQNRHFRVDPRLVHATIMNVWVPTVGAKALLISDDKIAQDSRLRKIQELSAIGLVEVAFSCNADTKTVLNEFSSNASVIVLFTSLLGVEKAVKEGLQIDRLNIGHIPKDENGELVHPSVYLGPDEHASIERLRSQKIDVFVQPLPSDKRICVARRPVSVVANIAQMRAAMTAQRSLRVVNERGLHLRAAHVFAHLAGRLSGMVTVLHNNGEVNAKSLLGLTTLGATCGTLLKVRVEGVNAEADLDQIEKLFESGFDEDIVWIDSDGGAP